MTKIEMFRQAAAEMGDVTPEEMSAFIERRFGVVIQPPYIPLFRATLLFQKKGSGSEQSAGPEQLPSVEQ